MRILPDNNVNRRFGQLLVGHDVTHVQEVGWEDLYNGDLIAAAEEEGFAAIVTADKQMRYQQNIKGRRISILVLDSRRILIEDIAPLAPRVLVTLDDLPRGSFITIQSSD